MPRIYSSCSDPIDYCSRHFPGPALAKVRHGNDGEGPDGRGDCFEYNADHPDYDDTDYKCNTCNCKLTSKDN